MAKRFTATDKWRKHFIKNLSTKNKLLWLYILDECDHAGIWDVELDIASMRIGEDVNGSTWEDFDGKIIPIEGGSKWFIPDFISYQYGKLNDKVNAHKSAILRLKSVLNKEQFNEIIKCDTKKNELFMNCSGTVKDKDKDKDKDKEEKELEKIPHELEARAFEFFGSVPLGNLREWLTCHDPPEIFEAMRLAEHRGIKTTNYVDGILAKGIKKNEKIGQRIDSDSGKCKKSKFAHLESEFL